MSSNTTNKKPNKNSVSKKQTGKSISSDDVEKYLQNNPQFLNDKPELLLGIIPPEKNYGDGVIDMQVFILKRIQNELEKYKTREKRLLKAAESNNEVLGRFVKAINMLMGANSIEEVCQIITLKLPHLFAIELATICIEDKNYAPFQQLSAQITLVEKGSFSSILDHKNPISLRSNIKGNKLVFGSAAQKIRSEALLPIDLGPKKPNALIALGAKEPDEFKPSQRTDLLLFFSNVLQKVIQRWID
ncbi:MAG: hypothetical protein CMM53_13080 [Rhodospirillaceae bacterium]|nr:hypothetical protein [Rhodospirillaceae bacterium]|tara:strand:+ start:307 stop:1041 length:735 start_codon:yes stop_codon:yes gene_type:complete